MPESLTSALLQAALAVVTIVTPVLAAFVASWLRSHTNASQLAILRTLAQSAVRAVEQTQEGDPGSKKYLNARSALVKMAGQHGVNVSDVQADALIEEACMGLRIAFSDVSAPPLPALTPQNRQPARRTTDTPKPATPRRTRKPKEVTA